jgi:type IX secretion system PorP/SprF family membrane protein
MKAITFNLILVFVLNQFYFLAQQDPIFTQFWNSSSYFNPATTGLLYKHQAVVNYRNQWMGMNGSPTSLLANYNTKIDKYKSGIGFNYLYETFGATIQNRFDLNYSYQLKLGDKQTLSVGASAGFKTMNFNLSLIGFDNNDPLVPKRKQETVFSSNFGIAYQLKKFTCGISSTQINEIGDEKQFFKFSRHYYVFASYDVTLNEKFNLKPQLLYRMNAGFMSTDLNVLVTYNKKYWLGVTNRDFTNFCFIAGLDLKEKFRVSYSYDLPQSKLISSSKGSHELTLGLLIK